MVFAAAFSACGQNLLKNAGFENAGGGGERPRDWRHVHFRTNSTASWGTENAHDGKRFAVCKSATSKQRGAWRQKVAVPDGTTSVVVGGWYRTRRVAASTRRSASVRVLFHRSLKKWDEIGLKQAFVPPAETWTQAEVFFTVPAGTKAVVLELFHWLTPGETQWDDAWVRIPTGKEAKRLMAAAKDQDMERLRQESGVDREPVFGRNLPYTPADGSVATTNPPPFLWVPAGTGVTYSLQIDRKPDFSSPDMIQREKLTWCCEMLTQRLAPGTWHWRYRVAKGNNTTPWSKTRTFTVPQDVPDWIYPGRDGLQVSNTHPRLFVRADQLPALRERAKNGDLKGTADALVRRVMRFAGEDLVPEPAWLPKDRAKRGPAYTLTFRATRPPMDKMERAGLAYLLTGDPACGAEAKRRVLHFFSWDPHGSTNVFHNDEPAMWVMMRGCRAYDWTANLFTDSEKKLVETSMSERAADFYKKMRGKPFENNPFESHAGRIIGFLGEAAIALGPDHPEAQKWLDYITHIYWGVYPAWGKEDGGWNEGPGYWSAYMSFGLHFVVALREATGVDLSKRPFFSATPYYKLYLTPPYSQMSPFGDGTQFKPSRPAGLMYWFSSLAKDPVIRWYADSLGRSGGSSILGIVLKDDSIQGRPPFGLPQARLFDGVGLVSLHSDFGNGDNDVIFNLRSSPYGAVSHGHNDQNCFVLEAYGEPLAIASGHYNRYSSPHHAGWTRETKAKCGITMDGGIGQDRGWHAKGQITAFVHGAAFDYVVGDATQAYGGRLDRAVREVVHVRPGVYVIRDTLASAEKRRFEYWLHAVDKMTVDSDANVVTITRPKAELRVSFLAPDALDYSQTDAFDPPPMWPPDRTFAKNWHVTATMSKPAKTTEFLTILAPRKTVDTAGPLSACRRLACEKGSAVELVWQDGSRSIIAMAAPDSAGGLVVGDIVSDGSALAVALRPDGTPTGWMLSGGTKLTVGGRSLVVAKERVLAAGRFNDTHVRVDSSGEGAALDLWCPQSVGSIVCADETLRFERPAADRVALVMPRGRKTAWIWSGKAPDTGPVQVEIRCGGEVSRLAGFRCDDGGAYASGMLRAPRGAYQVAIPAGVHFNGGLPDEKGRVWLRAQEHCVLNGAALPATLDFKTVLPAAELPAQLQKQMPTVGAIAFEAEKNWAETGGKIRVSKGGHKNVSGDDNLWGWNKTGHTITWSLDVPADGDYELWLVGATQTGLLAEAKVDDGDALALWFAPTGGWGRSKASEWRAYQLRTAIGDPATFNLAKGKHNFALTNRSGMGLNIDRIVLVRK